MWKTLEYRNNHPFLGAFLLRGLFTEGFFMLSAFGVQTLYIATEKSGLSIDVIFFIEVAFIWGFTVFDRAR